MSTGAQRSTELPLLSPAERGIWKLFLKAWKRNWSEAHRLLLAVVNQHSIVETRGTAIVEGTGLPGCLAQPHVPGAGYPGSKAACWAAVWCPPSGWSGRCLCFPTCRNGGLVITLHQGRLWALFFGHLLKGEGDSFLDFCGKVYSQHCIWTCSWWNRPLLVFLMIHSCCWRRS